VSGTSAGSISSIPGGGGSGDEEEAGIGAGGRVGAQA
jgi:hypothetical protein